ncbi:hypothetical protein FQA39_LY04707 [Lamprigera yunnana]|nr:hypothetical protein FQA39_LY04707 [Lamprigera yunnana]
MKSCEIDGLIVSNTTVERPDHLQNQDKTEVGGLIGQPLKDVSTKIISNMYKLTYGMFIIGVGGIFTGKDAYDKIKAGPPIVTKVKKELAQLLTDDGHTSVSEAVGSNNTFPFQEGTEGTIQQTPLIEEVSEQTIVTPNHRTRPEKEKLQAPLHPNIGKKRKSEELTNDVLVSVRDHFKKPPPQDDRYDLMGKSIALRIRALEKRQRLIVEKKINDIIFEAEMGLMNTPTNSYNLVYQSSSSSTTPSPSPNESFYEFNSHQARISGLGSQEEHTHPLANYLSEFRDI